MKFTWIKIFSYLAPILRLLLLLLHAMSYLIKALGKSVLAHSISTADQEGVGLVPSLSVVPGTLVDT